ncbi:MFS transporter [Actinomadura sp. 9N215]|uniref:MFS transporter n=1 Tax=Actinomadura sp. 9N215 TaxID=3375150 RepID=UPI003796B3EF
MANIDHQTDHHHRTRRRTSDGSARRVAAAATVGTGLEYYDFFLYGTAAALVFGDLFFPAVSSTTATLASFATFAVGFGARPLGALVFGHVGDRLGRKVTLLVTLLMMGAATFLIGLLPTYESIGLWAPAMLVLLRFLQGIGLGGEAAAAQLISVEHAPPGRRGFYGSWPNMASPIGSATSTGLVLLINLVLTKEQFLSWGWRIPFLLSLAVVAVGLFIRLRVAESPVFRQLKESRSHAAFPLVELIRTHPRALLLATGMWFGASIGFYLNAVYILTFATGSAGVGLTTMLVVLVIASVLSIGFPPAAGALSDRFGRRAVLIGCCLVSMVVAVPYFPLVGTGSPVVILTVLVVFNAGLLGVAGVQPALFGELFGPRVRLSGVSVSYTAATLLGGGLAPFVATALVAATAGRTWAVSAYLVAALVMSTVVAWFAEETRGTDLMAGKAGASKAGASGAGASGATASL